MKVITYATDPEHPRLRRFLAPACAHHGLHLVVLPEASRIGRMGSNRNKDVWLADFLRRLPEDEIILSTDGYDTFFLAGEEEILSTKGLADVGLTEDVVDVEVLDSGSKGLFGIGFRQARVRLTIKSLTQATEAEEKLDTEPPAPEMRPAPARRLKKFPILLSLLP